MGKLILSIPEQRVVIDSRIDPETYDRYVDAGTEVLEEDYDSIISDVLTDIEVDYEYEED